MFTFIDDNFFNKNNSSNKKCKGLLITQNTWSALNIKLVLSGLQVYLLKVVQCTP